jgi:hypothetical protein
MDIKQTGKGTVTLLSVEEPICKLSEKWKGLKDSKRKEFISKKNIALTLCKHGGYNVSKVYPD